MFHEVSREKLRQVLAAEFPELESFADCLYEDPGTTVLKRPDGTWEFIPVAEGFTQGCPASPIFAAIVLKCFSRKSRRT